MSRVRRTLPWSRQSSRMRGVPETALLSLLIMAAFALPQAVAGDEFGWKDTKGNPVTNTDNMKSVAGFGGWLVVTPDADWEEKWNTPSDVTPFFSEASEVHEGDSLTILIFFSNPKPDAAGAIDVTCDLRMIRPDGSYSVNEKEVECAKGPLEGDPMFTRLTSAVMKFVAEKNDPHGPWTVEVNVNDRVRSTTVPLKAQFVLR